ncbi:MAG: sensor histidine kinase [Acidobacteria bacterium]|nr:sensor histidine kinase [Acidobacteriota bacterium]
MNRTSRELLKYGAILVLILVISILHYKTSVTYQHLHEIYQRVYYIPILLAAFWYGPLGGISAAALTSAIYFWHIQTDWAYLPHSTFNQYAEIVLYHGVAIIIGLLSLKEGRQRKKLETTSRDLADAYEKLQETVERLEHADQLAALGQLSAGVAHEIRNPLASIKGSMEILENEIPPDHPKREFVGIIKEEIARLDSIVGEFLKFARPPQPSFEPTSVNELIDSTTALLQKQEFSVEIVKKQDPTLPLIDLDPDQIRQVLLNIMLNGIQAMPEGGILEVGSGISSDGRSVAIEISDEGEGIDHANLKRIFDPFFTTKPHGTGLGLSISYQLVQGHGGRIFVEKHPPRGTTFRIEFSLVSDFRPTSAGPVAAMKAILPSC